MQNIHFPFPREKSEYWEQPYLPHTDDLHTFPEPSWMQLWYIHSQYWMSHGNHFSIASRRKISSISHQHKGMPSSPSVGLKQKKDLHSPLFPSYLFLLGCLVVCFLLGFFFLQTFQVCLLSRQAPKQFINKQCYLCAMRGFLWEDGHGWPSQSNTRGDCKNHTSAHYSWTQHSPEVNFYLCHLFPHAVQCSSATIGRQICCSVQVYVKGVTETYGDTWTLSAVPKERGIVQQCKPVPSNNCHSWQCQEEVYNGSALWL